MASKLAPHSLCVHNSNGDDFEFGGGGEKGCCGKLKWNTVRQGEIWINGHFCEQEIYMHGGDHDGIDSHAAPDSWMNGHSEVDWIAKEIAFQDFILSETSTNQSDLHQGRTDFSRDEHDSDVISTLAAVAALFEEWCVVEADFSDPMARDELERASQMKPGKNREWALIDSTKTEQCNNVNPSISSPAQNAFLQTDWSNGNHTWNGFKTDDQCRFCHSSVDLGSIGGATVRAFKGNFKSTWVPDFAVQDLFQEITKASQDKNKAGVCGDSRLLEGDPHLQQPTPLQCNRSIVERERECVEIKAESPNLNPLANEKLDNELFVDTGFGNGHENYSEWTFAPGNMSLPLSNEEQSEGIEVYGGIGLDSRQADYLQQNFEASRLGFVCEREITGASGACMLLTGGLESQSANAIDEREFLMPDRNSNCDSIDSNAEGNFGSVPPDAFFYALSYMSLQDLLSMERVCTSLRDWIRNDVLLWRRLHVEPPFSKKFTDRALLQLASRSRGQLQCLCLVECAKVTEAAVKQVVSSSPRLSKLCLPGCSRINADAVVRIVKSHAENWACGFSDLKQLRIRNIYGLTREHVDILLSMLGPVEQSCSVSRKPQFYHNGHYSFFCDDERRIDVEACPKCSNIRLVYDCTRERCQQKQDNKLQECRGCILCIARCEECGRCINDNDYEETFCLDLLCSSCWLRLPKCSECNRPGCGRHADHFVRTRETTFVCGDCSGSFPGGNGPEFHVYG